MSSEVISAITNAIRTRFPERERVLGSYIGSLIQRQVPGVNLKADFGGLRAFIADHLSHQVTEIGRRGSDVEFYVDFASPQMPSEPEKEKIHDRGQESPQGIRHKPISINPWGALTNPSSIIQTLWNEQQQKLEFVLPDAVIPQDARLLPPLSYDELAEIARTFLAHKNILIPTERADPTDSRKYSTKITRILREKGLYDEWDAYRVDKMLRCISTRLKALGATEETTHQILAEVQTSRPQPHGISLPMKPLNIDETGLDSKRLRAFFVAAMEHMPIAELRELKISGLAIEKALAAF